MIVVGYELELVICELDYKGYYRRFALPKYGFEKEYPGIPYYGDDLDPVTLEPMVHLNIHELVAVDSEMWKHFFLDLADGLPDSDIERCNLAYIDWHEMADYHDTAIAVAMTLADDLYAREVARVKEEV